MPINEYFCYNCNVLLMFIDIERISEDIDKKNLPLREYLDSLVYLPNDLSAYSGGYPFSISGDIRSVPS